MFALASISLLSFFSAQAFAENTTLMTNINGAKFEAAFSEISQAYFTTHVEGGVNQQIANGDDTITILNPVFDYAGKQIPFGITEKGICGYFNFARSHGYEEIKKPGPVVYANMTKDGKLDKISTVEEGWRARVVSAVVCSNRD